MKNTHLFFITYLSLVIVILIFYYYRLLKKNKKKAFLPKQELNRTIWLLWLQGWENAPWLSQQVLTSWKVKNPGWKIVMVTEKNLKEYVDGIDYVYKETISPAAKSDIIRLNLLYKHGGVWADATLLCMTPLDSWVYEAIQPSQFWMYHGWGGGMSTEKGPASWFIISKAKSYIITKWKEECDHYWKEHETAHEYFWMDLLFKKLYETDKKFKRQWDLVPYRNIESYGESHSLASESMFRDDKKLKKKYDETPPFVLKMGNKSWASKCSDLNTEECQNSNGYYAIQIALKRKNGNTHKYIVV